MVAREKIRFLLRIVMPRRAGNEASASCSPGL